jgi:hypothetical protein
MLVGMDSSFFLRIHLYLARVSQTSNEISEATGQDIAAPTVVRYQINFGSPNFEGVFDGIGSKVGNNIESMIASGSTAVSLGCRKKKV